MPGASEKEQLARVLTELRAAIQASTGTLPPPTTALLATLQTDLSTLFPITPPAVALSPIQQLLPQVQDLTRQLQMPSQPLTGAVFPDTGADQRVGSSPPSHREQRVASPILAVSDDTDCPTIFPFATLPAPGRINLRPGGDNVTYARTQAPLTTVVPTEDVLPNTSTHVGNGTSNVWCTIAAKSLTAPSCNSESNGRHSKTRFLPIHGYPGIPPVCC